jgi:hypothetical protein
MKLEVTREWLLSDRKVRPTLKRYRGQECPRYTYLGKFRSQWDPARCIA